MKISKKNVEQIKKELDDKFLTESEIRMIYGIDKKVLEKIKKLQLEDKK